METTTGFPDTGEKQRLSFGKALCTTRDVLPDNITRGCSKVEALALISVEMLGVQLDASLGALLASVDHELVLTSMYSSICAILLEFTTNNGIDTKQRGSIQHPQASMLPALRSAISLHKSRCHDLSTEIQGLLERLNRLGASIKQYGDQNMSLVLELESAGVMSLATQKRKLAAAELLLVDRIVLLTSLSTNSMHIAEGECSMEKLELLHQNIFQRHTNSNYDALGITSAGIFGEGFGKDTVCKSLPYHQSSSNSISPPSPSFAPSSLLFPSIHFNATSTSHSNEFLDERVGGDENFLLKKRKILHSSATNLPWTNSVEQDCIHSEKEEGEGRREGEDKDCSLVPSWGNTSPHHSPCSYSQKSSSSQEIDINGTIGNTSGEFISFKRCKTV